MDALALLGFCRIERRVRPVRIASDGSSGRELRVVVGPVPVADPLPHIPRHVIEAVLIGRELRDGANADAASLKLISQATGGLAYVSRDPRDILRVFTDAITKLPAS